MAARMKHAALALALWMGAFAGACGSSTPPPETAADKNDFDGESSPDEGKATADAEGAKPAKPGKDAEAQEHQEEPAAPAKSTPLQATKFEADLKKIGINLKKIPELEKLPAGQKKKVMPLLQKALGYDTCEGCHVEGDFKKETRNMKVAREMWRHFVAPLRSESGGTLFCDSCHAGNEHVLNRKDKKALQAFMEEEYQNKVSRANKEDMECGTCHGDAMETKIIEKLWNIPK